MLKGNYHTRRSIYTTIRELGPKYHTIEGIRGPNFLTVVYVDPLGYTHLRLFIVPGRFASRVKSLSDAQRSIEVLSHGLGFRV